MPYPFFQLHTSVATGKILYNHQKYFFAPNVLLPGYHEGVIARAWRVMPLLDSPAPERHPTMKTQHALKVLLHKAIQQLS